MRRKIDGIRTIRQRTRRVHPAVSDSTTGRQRGRSGINEIGTINSRTRRHRITVRRGNGTLGQIHGRCRRQRASDALGSGCLGIILQVDELRHGRGRQNPQDHDHDDQFDQGKTLLLFHIDSPIKKLLQRCDSVAMLPAALVPLTAKRHVNHNACRVAADHNHDRRMRVQSKTDDGSIPEKFIPELSH